MDIWKISFRKLTIRYGSPQWSVVSSGWGKILKLAIDFNRLKLWKHGLISCCATAQDHRFLITLSTWHSTWQSHQNPSNLDFFAWSYIYLDFHLHIINKYLIRSINEMGRLIVLINGKQLYFLFHNIQMTVLIHSF